MCDCGPSCADLITDAAAGDVVCRRCGVVVQGHIFDEHLEFYGEHAGPRAGPAESWLLPARPVVLDLVPHRRRVLSNPDPHATVRRLFDAVDNMGHSYSTDVRETAKLLCRDLAERRTLRSTAWPLYCATALYLATKMHGNGIGRSKKEIATQFAGNGVTEQAVTVTAKQFREELHATPYAQKLFSGLCAGDLINRSVDLLRVDKGQRNAIKKAAHVLAERVPVREAEGKTPSSICAGVLACVLHSLGVKLSKKHVAECCRVSAATLDKMTKTVMAWTALAAADSQPATAVPA